MTDRNVASDDVVDKMQACFRQLRDADAAIISPGTIALMAVDEFDPSATAEVHLRWGALQHFKQIARSFLREHVDPTRIAANPAQAQLFDGQLQMFYPAQRDGEQVYVQRSQLTIAERRENADWMRKASDSLAKHADALDAETDKLSAAGVLLMEMETA